MVTKDGKPTVIDSAYRVAKMNIRGDRLYTKKAKEFMRKKPYKWGNKWDEGRST